MKASRSQRPPSLKPALSRSRLQAASAAPTTFSRKRFYRLSAGSFLSPQGAKALEWASQFADEFHAELTIAHITLSTEGRAGEYFNPEVHGRWAMETRQEEFVTLAREKLETMRKSADANATVFIDSGNDIPQAVCSAASELDADLVVVGRGSSEGIERLRTKVYSIVRQSPCPVVSV
jgi:nucleotide-binding universal stress UspA family protein